MKLIREREREISNGVQKGNIFLDCVHNVLHQVDKKALCSMRVLKTRMNVNI